MDDERSRRYIFLWVRIQDNPVWTQLSPIVFKVAVGLMLRANYKEGKWYDGKSERSIPRGSMVTTLRKFAESCHLTEQQVRTSWDHLDRINFARFESTHLSTVVTLINYDTYQPGGVMMQQTPNTASTHAPHTANTHITEYVEEIEYVEETLFRSPDGAPVTKPKRPNGLPAKARPVGATLPASGTALNPPVNGKPWVPEGVERVNGGERKRGTEFDPEFDSWFEGEFWPTYPRKVSKTAAKRAAQRKMTTPERRAQALRVLESELPDILSREPQYRPHGSTWFNQDRWNDTPEPDPVALVPAKQARHQTKAEQRDALFADRLFREMNAGEIH